MITEVDYRNLFIHLYYRFRGLTSIRTMDYELEAILSVDTTQESRDSFHRYLGRTMGVSRATGKTIEKAYYSARDTLAEMIQIIETSK